MSQSPIDDFSFRATIRYKQGWKALNRLLHEDRSFSGRERNCAFLNTGNSAAFADISATSGLDFADDARAIAVTDWDFDGNLDLWITNRTAPRVRLLRNGSRQNNHFLAIKLQGDGQNSNRDAIGARLELTMDGPDNNSTIIKTLRAGEGFLSQSSNWLHFGLGQATRVKQLVVKWPGGEKSEFQEVEVDQYYTIQQEDSKIKTWQPPKQRKTLEASVPKLPNSTQQARIVVTSRLLLPAIRTKDGQEINANLNPISPTLVNLWSANCSSCIDELSDWSRNLQLKKNFDVMAINVDDNNVNSDQILKEHKIDLPSFQGTPELVQTLDIFQRAILDRWQPLPVPCTFLLDPRGQVAIIYKGPVSSEQLLADSRLLDVSPAKLRDLGTPFKGRWITPPANAEPLHVSSQFIDNAKVEEGVAYLRRYTELVSQTAPKAAGDVYYVLAVILHEQGRVEESLAAMRQSVQYNPDDFRARETLANVLVEQGQVNVAAEQLLEALRIKPNDINVLRKLAIIRMNQKDYAKATRLFGELVRESPRDVTSWYNLGKAFWSQGDFKKAAVCYQKTLELDPQMLMAANDLAWIQATQTEPGIGNPRNAVKLAELICKKTDYQQPNYLDTLAVAYAGTGDFDRAVETCQMALQLLKNAGHDKDIGAIQERKKLFEQRIPYREQPNK